jgi:peroxiredoxin
MTEPRNLLDLPADLPVPVDDDACAHLPGMRLPSLALPATDGSMIDLSTLPGRSIVYVYPRTGRPDQPLPAGWDEIPGARGCTPQSCAYRDLAAELGALGARVFGLSTQDTAYQREAATRLHLPFPLLSDERRELTTALSLPTFEVDGMTLDAHQAADPRHRRRRNRDGLLPGFPARRRRRERSGVAPSTSNLNASRAGRKQTTGIRPPRQCPCSLASYVLQSKPSPSPHREGHGRRSEVITGERSDDAIPAIR